MVFLASLSIAVFNRHGELVQCSLGGLEIPYITTIGRRPIDDQENGELGDSSLEPIRSNYMSRNKVVQEAIALALHPMIRMRDYPDSPEYYPSF